MDLKRVKLKPKSPEFVDDDDYVFGNGHICEMPECNEKADHKAPKSRGLNEYYHFCLKHVQEYNRAWNFFDGMAPQDIEQHMKDNFYGHRPTWRYDSAPDLEDDLRQRAFGFRDAGPEHEKTKRDRQNNHNKQDIPSSFAKSAETEALAIMELSPPLDLEKIKARYKELAKKHHPDLNKNDEKSEELFKKINMAYTVLKLAFEKYETYEDI